MKLKALFVVLFFFSATYCYCQEKIWTSQSKLSEIILFEKSINNSPKFLDQNISLSEDYYPLFDKYRVSNPLIIQRDPVGYLPLYAQYFYTPEDSVLRLISYDWEIDEFGNFFDKQKIWKKESTKLKQYNNEYERVKSILLNQLGTPTSTDNEPKQESSERGKYFTRETIWESDDIHAELNMIFESMTYRVRLTLYWKK